MIAQGQEWGDEQAGAREVLNSQPGHLTLRPVDALLLELCYFKEQETLKRHRWFTWQLSVSAFLTHAELPKHSSLQKLGQQTQYL